MFALRFSNIIIFFLMAIALINLLHQMNSLHIFGEIGYKIMSPFVLSF